MASCSVSLSRRKMQLGTYEKKKKEGISILIAKIFAWKTKERSSFFVTPSKQKNGNFSFRNAKELDSCSL